MDAANQSPKPSLLGRRGAKPVASSTAPQTPTMRRGWSVAQRLVLIALALLVPLVFAVGTVYTQQQADIGFAAQERDGATYLREVNGLFQKVVTYRSLVDRQRLGDRAAIAQRQRVSGEIAASFAKLDELDARFGEVFKSTADYTLLKTTWKDIEQNLANRSPAASLVAQDVLIERRLLGLIRTVTNNSKLILDPSLDTFYLMDLTTQRLPTLINNLDQLGGLGASLLQSNEVSQAERATIIALLSVARQQVAAATTSLNTAFEANPSLKPLSEQLAGVEGAAVSTLTNSVQQVFISQLQPVFSEFDYFDSIKRVVNAYGGVLTASSDKLYELLDNRVNTLQNTQRLLLLGLLALLVIVGVLVFINIRSITRPLSEMANVAQRFGSGDLNQSMPVRTQDEIGQLGMAFNASMGQLRGFFEKQEEERAKGQHLQQNIGEFLDVAMQISGGDLTQKGKVSEDVLGNVVDAINLMTEEVGYLLKDVQQTTNQVNSGAQALTHASRNIVMGAQSQAKIAADTENEILEVSRQIETMSSSAADTAKVATEALQASEQGRVAVQETLTGMNAIRREVSNISKGVKSLSDRSLEIQEIVDTISGIAAQTNLLSLNAAIEASGAGEAGARFAIVADEVRKLAEDSAKSTQRVASLIKGIQTEIQGLVVGIEDGTKEVEQGYRIAAQAGERLEQISSLAQQSAAFAEEISKITRAQVERVQGVAGAVQTIAETAQETQKQSQTGQASAEQLRALAQALNANLERFKLPA
jgi:twitching motility protein PilJ